MRNHHLLRRLSTTHRYWLAAVTTLAAATFAYSFAVTPAQTPASVNAGRALYRQYCASCHGLEGKGDGPAAASLKVAPPDLTLIQKAGERFPSRRIIDSVEGEKLLSAHGSREMPVWGRVFRRASGGKLREPLYIYNLVNYLESIQVNNVTSK